MQTPRVLVLSAKMGSNSHNKMVPQIGVDAKHIRLNDLNYPTRAKSMHPRLVGKVPKMLGWELYPDYDYYVWVDGSFDIVNPNMVSSFLTLIQDKDLLLYSHPSRSCIWDEYEFCSVSMKSGNQYLLDRYEHENMETQYDLYLSNEDFVDDKLFAAGVFMYSKKLVENKEHNVMKEWFYHNCLYSVQDQLSLPYLLWKFNVSYNVIKEDIYLSKLIHDGTGS